MNKLTQYITTFSALLLFVFNIQYAEAQEYKYSRSPGWYTIGINGGLAYQQSDVPNQLCGFGFGVTLAKNIWYDQDMPLSFDLRGRLLYNRTYGLDYQRSTGILNNEALNGSIGLDYREANGQSGFVYSNHLTHVGEAAIEGVLTLSQLWQKTGIIVSLYGGIGLDYYSTFIDQRNTDGLYSDAYQNINTSDSRSKIRRTLRNDILDLDYETRADGFSDGGKFGFFPALGLELGYQLTPALFHRFRT